MGSQIERDIMKNADYVLNYFGKQDKNLTNLMLEKLLYFLEAIYMTKTDENYLYNNGEFLAYDFGPVNKLIYDKYKVFGRLEIPYDKDIIIPDKNREYIQCLYEIFESFTAFDLVSLSHLEGSPWAVIYKIYEGDIPKNIVIEKKATKEWFSSITNKS